MLLLLASRWMLSIIGTLRKRSSAGRSVAVNALALFAYVAGAAQFISETDANWIFQLTGFFFALNIVLILIDTTLIIDYSNRSTPVMFIMVGSLTATVALFLGFFDPNVIELALAPN